MSQESAAHFVHSEKDQTVSRNVNVEKPTEIPAFGELTPTDIASIAWALWADIRIQEQCLAANPFFPDDQMLENLIDAGKLPKEELPREFIDTQVVPALEKAVDEITSEDFQKKLDRAFHEEDPASQDVWTLMFMLGKIDAITFRNGKNRIDGIDYIIETYTDPGTAKFRTPEKSAHVSPSKQKTSTNDSAAEAIIKLNKLHNASTGDLEMGKEVTLPKTQTN